MPISENNVKCLLKKTYGAEKMSDFEKVGDLLKGGDSPIKEVIVVRSVLRLELKDGNVIKFAREQTGGIDWLAVRLNDKIVRLI